MQARSAKRPLLRFFSTATKETLPTPAMSVKRGEFKVEHNTRSFLSRIFSPNIEPTGWGGNRVVPYRPSIIYLTHGTFAPGSFACFFDFTAQFYKFPEKYSKVDAAEQFGVGITDGHWFEADVRKVHRKRGAGTTFVSADTIREGTQNLVYHGVIVQPLIVKDTTVHAEVEFYLDVRRNNLESFSLKEMAVFELSKEEHETTFGKEEVRNTPEGRATREAGTAALAARFDMYRKASREVNPAMDAQPTRSVGKHL